MSYLVELTDRARRDADHIFEWIAQRSPDGAERWYTSFRAALESLRSTPLSRAPTPESEAFDFEIRQLLFKTPRGRPYRALYTIEGQRVRILTVRGPGQPPVTPEDVAS